MYVVGCQIVTHDEELAKKIDAALRAALEQVLREAGLPTEQLSTEGFGVFEMPTADQAPDSGLDDWIQRYMDGERAFHQRRFPFTDL